MRFILIMIIIMLTHLIISKIGMSLSEIDGLGWKYVSFDFEEERKKPMTINALMNIVIPNILMMFLFEIYKYLGWENVADIIWIYVAGCYVYRLLLITIFLRRKELYATKYELSIAAIGTLISVIILYGFLLRVDTWFISVDELREEIWFALIVVAYGCIKNLVNSKILQEDILSQDSVERYIKNKLKYFFKTYKNDLTKYEDNPRIIVFLLAIMIYEDYNRGPLKRKIEYVKLLVCGRATVSIMQVNSESIISDKQGIGLAYDIVKKKYEQAIYAGNTYLTAYDLALEYNPDYTYASNVEYINSVVFETMKNNSQMFGELGLEQYDSGDMSNLFDIDSSKMKEQRTIRLQSNLIDGVIEDENIRIRKDLMSSSWELVIRNLYNTELLFDEKEYYTEQKHVPIFTFENCNSVLIKGIAINGKSKILKNGNDGIRFSNCNDVYLEDVAINDCDGYGIRLDNSDITLEDCHITNCFCGALRGFQSSAVIKNSIIEHCNTNADYRKRLVLPRRV